MVDRIDSVSRRRFLHLAGALAAGTALGPLFADGLPHGGASVGEASLTLRPDVRGAQISETLIGLSYETLQLHDADFFSRHNTALIGLLRRLNPHGVLRIGGNSSDYSVWSEYRGELPTFENPPGAVFSRPYPITPRQLANLAEFLRATGWRLIFGVNLKIDKPPMAAQLAQAVKQAVGEQLLAIQIGNEPNDYPRADGKPIGYDDYLQRWQRSAQAIRAAVAVPIAGPDTGASTDWVLRFAQQVPDIAALSRHYYRGGAHDATTSIAQLLAGDPHFFAEAAQIAQAAGRRGLPCYLTEVNSYYSGGKLGVSNTFAAALWGGDFALAAAQAGITGIQVHSGMLSVLEASLDKNVAARPGAGDYKQRLDAVSGRYSPIAGDAGLGFYARPLYHGLLLAQQFGGARFIGTELAANDTNLTAYAADKHGHRLFALFNKDARRDVDVHVTLGETAARVRLWRLQAPALEEIHQVSFAGAEVGHDGSWTPGQAEIVPVVQQRCSLYVPRGSAVLAFVGHA